MPLKPKHKPLDTLSLATRIIMVLAGALFLILLVYIWLLDEHRKHDRFFMSAYYAEKVGQADRVLALINDTLFNFAYDYALWTDMFEFALNPTDEGWEDLMEGGPEKFDVHVVYVYDAKYNPVYGVDFRAGKEAAPILAPFVQAVLQHGADPSFFYETEHGLLQLKIVPIHKTADSDLSGPSSGYFVAGRYWDEAHIERLGLLLGAEAELTPWEDRAVKAKGNQDTTFQYRVQLNGWNGKPLAVLDFEDRLEQIQAVHEENHRQMTYVFSALVGILVLFMAIVTRWVVAPLRNLTRAMETEDSEAVEALYRSPSEWRQVAALFQRTLDQQDKLKAEVTERREAEDALLESELRLRDSLARREAIARDLHDGIIQSIYAIGLGVEQARLSASKDTVKTGKALLEVREGLNRIIGDVRGFISEVAPERLMGKHLQESLDNLIQTLRNGPIAVDLEVDYSLLEAFDGEEQKHLFHLIHELISNSIRHSGGTRVICRLYSTPEGECVLEVEDDGKGAPVEAIEASVGGIRNVRSRVERLRGILEWSSGKSGGTLVKITLNRL